MVIQVLGWKLQGDWLREVLGLYLAVEISREVRWNGYDWVGVNRSVSGEAAVSSIISSTGNKMVVCIQLDLLDLKSVRKFADDVTKKEKKVDILVNNAGIAKHPKVSATRVTHRTQVWEWLE